MHRRTEAGGGVSERAAHRLRRELVLEELAPGGVELLREGARVPVPLRRLRVPLRRGIGVLGRRLLLQPVAEQSDQSLPEGLGADQRLARVLRGGEDLDRLRRGHASLRAVHRIVVFRFQMVADPVSGPQPQGGQLPDVRAAQALRGSGRGLQHHPLFLAAGALPHQRDLGQPVVVGGGPADLHPPLGIHLQHRLLGRVDAHLWGLVGHDLDGPRGPLGDGPPPSVGEAQAPLAGLGELEGAGELPVSSA